MTWNEILTQIFQLIIFPILGIGGIYLTCLISAKIKQIKESKDNDLYNKYLTMLDNTITNCVLATTQTYVDTLKKQGKFDLEAQKIAFQQTYDNVMSILADDAKKYLQSAIGDLQTYVSNRIEAEVNCNK